ncbi:hypothetical protein DM02DRAFT_651032 [Periconia macrospinosa]|uniref:Uncharacterized protein n=1 Tax=Periconia macrospinosa TaxID=97972 RepID=A0A2V1E3K0_9PLEO|nr:hypothetical protein DM02DRAFT_651032 [Periconia macrospinosa]
MESFLQMCQDSMTVCQLIFQIGVTAAELSIPTQSCRALAEIVEVPIDELLNFLKNGIPSALVRRVVDVWDVLERYKNLNIAIPMAREIIVMVNTDWESRVRPHTEFRYSPPHVPPVEDNKIPYLSGRNDHCEPPPPPVAHIRMTTNTTSLKKVLHQTIELKTDVLLLYHRAINLDSSTSGNCENESVCFPQLHR